MVEMDISDIGDAFNIRKYDRYEYIGDAILHMIITNETMNNHLLT